MFGLSRTRDREKNVRGAKIAAEKIPDPDANSDSTRSVSENPLLEFDENSKNEAHAMFRTYKTKGFRASGAKSTAMQHANAALEVSGNATNVSTVPHLRTPKSTSAGLPTVALCSRSI